MMYRKLGYETQSNTCTVTRSFYLPWTTAEILRESAEPLCLHTWPYSGSRSYYVTRHLQIKVPSNRLFHWKCNPKLRSHPQTSFLSLPRGPFPTPHTVPNLLPLSYSLHPLLLAYRLTTIPPPQPSLPHPPVPGTATSKCGDRGIGVDVRLGTGGQELNHSSGLLGPRTFGPTLETIYRVRTREKALGFKFQSCHYQF